MVSPPFYNRWKEGEEKEDRKRTGRKGKREGAKKESQKCSKKEERYVLNQDSNALLESWRKDVPVCVDSGTDDDNDDDDDEDTPKKKTKKKTPKDSSPPASSAKEKKSKSKGRYDAWVLPSAESEVKIGNCARLQRHRTVCDLYSCFIRGFRSAIH